MKLATDLPSQNSAESVSSQELAGIPQGPGLLS